MYPDFSPLVKCKHCGQWAAVFTACVHCGAPVDPDAKGNNFDVRYSPHIGGIKPDLIHATTDAVREYNTKYLKVSS